MKYMAALFLVAVAAAAHSAPFLVCDVYPPSGPLPTHFILSIDGKPELTVPATDAPAATPGKWLHYDLAGITFGRHTVTVKAKNAATTTAATAPFTFDVGLALPDGLIITPN